MSTVLVEPQNTIASPMKSNGRTVRFGVVGYGYWGPNIVRNLDRLDHTELVAVCDKRIEARQKVAKMYPNIVVTDDSEAMMTSEDIDAIAVVTPVWTHYELAKSALQNGKHIFVEKPFTSTAAQAEELIGLAAKTGLKIMVDHTFLFTAAVQQIKHLLDSGALGKLYYYDSTRINLGLFQHDINVLWDLAPHDLSIMDHLIGNGAEAVSATGQTHLNGHEDIAFITVYFPEKVIAHVNVNWLSPVKVRTTLIGGEKQMLVWNDIEVDEKIKVYDKGVKMVNPKGLYDVPVQYRAGDMWAPHLEQIEALTQELRYFADCIVNGQTPTNDGNAGLRVVKMLEAASESLRKRGALIYV